MLKSRLIFALLMKNGSYQLSRNFNLQDVGDLNWIKKHYNFDAIVFSIDELIVVNVERGEKNVDLFCDNLLKLNENCFMPIAAGGGIRSMDDAYKILNSGADKIIVNTPLISQQNLVRSLVETFGSQCVIASIDYKKIDNEHVEVLIDNGSKSIELSLDEAVENAHELGCGEIYLTSIEQDGTGYGYDLKILDHVVNISKMPVIASGGAGKYKHFVEGVQKAGASAVSTANLFNFIADGLIEVRKTMIDRGLRMATWNLNFRKINFVKNY
jgi:cyclase